MKKFQLSKDLENVVRNNVRYDETAPWSYIVFQDKHLAHGEAALKSKFEKIKKFAERHNGYCKVTKGLSIVGDNKEICIEMNCDTVAAKAFDAILNDKGRSIVYLFMDAERVWTADVPFGRVPVGAVRFCEEKEYPVDLYYYRTDINGSGSVEKDVCQNRNELLKSLNWFGECGYTPLQLWDFRAETTRDERVMKIFAAGAERRYEATKETLDDMIADAIALGKKEYSLVLCKGEQDEERVLAYLMDEEVALIKKDLSGELNTGINIKLTDGREIEIGIIDEISVPQTDKTCGRLEQER